jgi:succinyl-CoA synthetase beta subunit
MFSPRISQVTRIASSCCGAVRNLNLHEYQSIGLLAKYGVKVQNGAMAQTGLEAKKVAENLLAKNPDADLILKAQIHAGGRGKGYFKKGLKGGVLILKNAFDCQTYADRMIGDVLVTHQTGESGQMCGKVLVNEVCIYY